MNLSPDFLIKVLKLNGFIFKRAKGSHQLFYNPATNKTITVPVHNGKDLKKELFLLFLNKQVLIKQNYNYFFQITPLKHWVEKIGSLLFGQTDCGKRKSGFQGFRISGN